MKAAFQLGSIMLRRLLCNCYGLVIPGAWLSAAQLVSRVSIEFASRWEFKGNALSVLVYSGMSVTQSDAAASTT